MRNSQEFLPLSQSWYLILASLMPGPRHGYAIGKEVEALSDGAVRLAIGNLYVAIKRLLDEGLIERAGDKEVEGGRRKLYRLTALGEAVVQLDAQRMRRMAQVLQDLRPALRGM
jgi:DNA-binding PadR family transcriptional regulator